MPPTIHYTYSAIKLQLTLECVAEKILCGFIIDSSIDGCHDPETCTLFHVPLSDLKSEGQKVSNVLDNGE